MDTVWTIMIIDHLYPSQTEIVGVYSSKNQAMAQMWNLKNTYALNDVEDCPWGTRFYATHEGRNFLIDIEEHEVDEAYILL